MSINPVSRDYGASQKGGSIARFYINRYVEQSLKQMDLSKKLIIEVGNDRYSRSIVNADNIIISNKKQDDRKYVFADLETGIGCEDDMGDIFILTNVLSCLFDVGTALANINRMIKKGGRIIITVPGIAQLSPQDYNSYGQYWRFTPMCLERLIQKEFKDCYYTCESFGNVKAASHFLYGKSVLSMSMDEILFKDDDYPMIIGASIVK